MGNLFASDIVSKEVKTDKVIEKLYKNKYNK